MRYAAIVIYENAHNQKTALFVEDEDGKPRYFDSVAEIRANINPNFPGETIHINLDTLESDIL